MPLLRLAFLEWLNVSPFSIALFLVLSVHRAQIVFTTCAETKEEQELDWHAPTVFLDEDIFQSGLRKCVGPNDTNGWSDPGAKNFMVRGRTYNDDGLKVYILTLPYI